MSDSTTETVTGEVVKSRTVRQDTHGKIMCHEINHWVSEPGTYKIVKVADDGE